MTEEYKKQIELDAEKKYASPHIAPYDNWHNNSEVLILQQKAYIAGAEEEASKGAVWVRAKEYIDNSIKNLESFILTPTGEANLKLLIDIKKHFEWLNETHIPEKGSEKDFQWNDAKIKEMIYSKLALPEHYFGKLQKCLDEFKHQQAEQTNPVSELSDEEIEKMAKKECKSEPENYFNSARDRTAYFKGFIKGAKAIRDKAALQTSAGWSDDSLLGLVKHVFIEAQKGGGYTKETGETLLKQYKQSQNKS